MNRFLLFYIIQFILCGFNGYYLDLGASLNFALILSLSIITFVYLYKSKQQFLISLLGLIIIDFLFFSHVSLRVRDFTDQSVDILVLTRVGLGLAIIIIVFSNSKFLNLIYNGNMAEKLLIFFGLYLCLMSSFSVTPLYSLVCGVLWFSIASAIFCYGKLMGAEKAFEIIALGMMGLIILSILYLFFIPDRVWVVDYAGGVAVRRFAGAFLHPVQLGNGVSIFSTYFFMASLLATKNRLKSWLYLSLSFFGIMLMFWAQSRVAIVATLASFVVIRLYLYPVKTSLMIFILLITGSVIISALSSDVLLKAFTRSGNVRELMTFTNRTGVWIYAQNWIYENPLWGYGFGATRNLFANAPSYFGWNVAHSHNFFIQGLIEVGFIGFMILSVPIFSLFSNAIVHKNLFAALCLVQILTRGMTEVVLFFYAPGLMVAFFGMAIARSELEPRSEKR